MKNYDGQEVNFILDEEALAEAAEAAHYAQGLDDYGVANEDEIQEATDLARAAVVAYIAATGLTYPPSAD